MARNILIQIPRGLEANIGTLAVGELGYCTDTYKLYIGTAAGNMLLVAAATVGDMLKSIYDTNNDGKVDYASQADSVSWSGIAGKPSTYDATLGETSATAYRGDRGKTAYDHSQTVHAPANANYYVHPTGDGNLHVPATSTTNSGKVLTAGATAGSLSWTALPTSLPANGGTSAACTGNAATATKLQTGRKINGVTFDGSADITIPITTTGLTWNQLKGV